MSAVLRPGDDAPEWWCGACSSEHYGISQLNPDTPYGHEPCTACRENYEKLVRGEQAPIRRVLADEKVVSLDFPKPIDVLARRGLTSDEVEQNIRDRWSEDPTCKRCGGGIPRPEIADLVYTDKEKTNTDLIHSSCLVRRLV